MSDMQPIERYTIDELTDELKKRSIAILLCTFALDGPDSAHAISETSGNVNDVAKCLALLTDVILKRYPDLAPYLASMAPLVDAIQQVKKKDWYVPEEYKDHE